MILKFQLGGASLPPLTSYEPVTVTGGGTSAGTTTASTKSDDSSDLTDKDILKMLEKLDGLPNDMLLIESELQNFYINLLYGINTSSIESRYLSILRQMKEANFHKALYNEAFNVVKSNGGINEIAIDERGNLICVNSKGDFKVMSVEDLKKSEGYTPLTNSELLQLRAHNPEIAFNNNLLSIVSNGIGIKTVTEMIKNGISSLGTTTNSNEMYAKTNANAMLRGIQDFIKASQESNLSYNATVENLYKGKQLTKSLAELAQNALHYLWKTLPENAKTLLVLKSDTKDERGAVELVGKLVTSTLDNGSLFSLNLENSPNTGSTNKEGKKGASGFDMDPVQLLLNGYGLKQSIVILTASGYNNGIELITTRMPIVTKEGASIGSSATLTDVTTSGFSGYLDFENASMGGTMIPTVGFDNIAINGTALYTGYLPIDLEEYNNTGNIKPDIALLGRYKEAQNKIAEENITDPELINEVYQLYKLPVMYDSNGDVLMQYKKFGMLNATALELAFNEDVSFDDYLFETSDANVIQNTLNILNKGRNKDSKIDFDEKSFFDSVFGTDYDHVYKGTVFIPVNEDHFTATAGFGNYPSVSEALTIEAKQQAQLRLTDAKNNYVNPGKL